MPKTPSTSFTPKTAMIIGAGIAGCSIAYALAKRDIHCTLIDPKGIAKAGSNRRSVLLQPAPDRGMSPPSLYYTAAFDFTYSLLQQLKKQGHDTGFKECGTFRPSSTPELHERHRKILHVNQWSIDKMQWLTALESSRNIGVFSKNSGLWFPQAGWLDTQKFCKALVNSYPHVELINSQVQQFHFDSNEWFLFDQQKEKVASAEILVIANAHAAQDFKLLKSLPLRQVRGQQAYPSQTTQSTALKAIISGKYFCTPAEQGQHIIGATYQRDDLDGTLRSTEQQVMFTETQKLLPNLFSSKDIQEAPLQGSVGWRCVAENRLPLAGQLHPLENLEMWNASHCSEKMKEALQSSYYPNLYVSLAHGARGFTSAPLVGECIAAIIEGKALPISKQMWEMLSPARLQYRIWKQQRKRQVSQQRKPSQGWRKP